MKLKAAVLKEFNKPLVIEEFETAPLNKGEILVKILSAGVCGSDVHMWHGKDPRTPVPIILGHEGVGIVEDFKSARKDMTGAVIKKGDLIVWNRGITCGKCYFCKVIKKSYLCPTRKTYGISISCKEPPYINGCYSQYIHLKSVTEVLKITKKCDASTLVSATCSGATTAHALEMANIAKGATVVVQGPGPIGIYAVVFAREMGARQVIVIGMKADESRLALCKEFGATDTLIIENTTPEQRLEFIKSKTNGLLADTVVECTGSPRALNEGIQMVMPGGTYLIPGIATPTGDVPFDVYTFLARKNVNIQGVWVSDANHLKKAVGLVLKNKYPFEKLVTHKFSLEQATDALQSVADRKSLKAVIIP